MNSKKKDGLMEGMVSIIVPTYNSSYTIGSTLESIALQTYKNYEVIAVDDGSSDSTVEIIQSFESKLSSLKVIIKEVNAGVADSRNVGIKEASGEFIAFLDSDDLWLQDKLQVQVEFMKNTGVEFSYTSYYVDSENLDFKRELRKAPKEITYKSMLRGNVIGCLTVMYRQEKAFNVSIPLIAKRNDYALWLKILRLLDIGKGLDQPLAIYNKRENSLSSGSKMGLLKYHFLVFRESEGFSVSKSMFYTIRNIFTFIKER